MNPLKEFMIYNFATCTEIHEENNSVVNYFVSHSAQANTNRRF